MSQPPDARLLFVILRLGDTNASQCRIARCGAAVYVRLAHETVGYERRRAIKVILGKARIGTRHRDGRRQRCALLGLGPSARPRASTWPGPYPVARLDQHRGKRHRPSPTTPTGHLPPRCKGCRFH
jgi:hypothetical protein